MKTATVALASLTALSLAPAFAQGSLTPPGGAPAPVMKTLDQVEPRIPLVDGQPGVSINGVGTISINAPGSYYLTGNLKIVDANSHGIEVMSSDVSIDLSGYTLICNTTNGGDAIRILGASNVRIHSGIIDGGTIFTGSSFSPTGWDNGVFSTDPRPGLVVSDLIVRGVSGHGIFLAGGQSRVERCSVNVCPGTGIQASTVVNCSVTDGGATGINAVSAAGVAVVDNCISHTVIGGGSAIVSQGTVSNSHGKSVGGDGIRARTAINSVGRSTSGEGIHADTSATNCEGNSYYSTGIAAVTSVSNCYGASIEGIGINSSVVTNSVGESTSGSDGIFGSIVSYSRGSCGNGGDAVDCNTAVACTTSLGPISAPNKQLGTP